MEVLIIIAIMSILMAFSVDWYIKYQAQRALQTSANNLANEIQWLKAQSIGGNPYGIAILSADATSYIVFRDNDLDCKRNSDGSEDLRTVSFISPVRASEPVSFIIDRRGYPLSFTCALGMQTIILKGNYGNQKNVIIDKYGRVRIQ
ncbi:prepilin-type N-terminal cleavage/methylation domain-containing protein [Thermodesulfovibrio hydrogeniphilus]